MGAETVFKYILTELCDSDLSEYSIGLLGAIVAYLRINYANLSYTILTPLGIVLKEGSYVDMPQLQGEIQSTLDSYLSKPKVIWFNTWFSSIASVIADIKEALPSIKVIATNKSEQCTYRNVADEFYIEPFGCSPSEYMKFALDFCKEHNVDIIWPKSYSMTLQKNIEKFNCEGIGIISDNTDALSICRSKDETYKYLTEKGYTRIPEYYIVSNVKDFKNCYNKLIKSGDICFKFDADEGASSFRIIRKNRPSFNSLMEKTEDTISYSDAIEILSDNGKRSTFRSLMVMPFLAGPEISVDCYNSPNIGFVGIPRYKVSGRIKKILLKPQIIEDARRIGELLGLKSAYNVQYRWDRDNKLVLLEVNTRISGGIQMSSLAGISIPNQVLADSIGVSIPKGELRECTVTQYEKAILI